MKFWTKFDEPATKNLMSIWNEMGMWNGKNELKWNVKTKHGIYEFLFVKFYYGAAMEMHVC